MSRSCIGRVRRFEGTAPGSPGHGTRMSINEVRRHAKSMHRLGEFSCSEAVAKAIRDRYLPDLPHDLIAAASGFPRGHGRVRLHMRGGDRGQGKGRSWP